MSIWPQGATSRCLRSKRPYVCLAVRLPLSLCSTPPPIRGVGGTWALAHSIINLCKNGIFGGHAAGQISGAVFPASSALPCRNVLCATAASRSCCCQVPSPPAISGRGGSAASEVRMALVHQPTIRVRRRWVTGDSWELFFGNENGEKKECGKNAGKLWENWAKTPPNNRRKLFPDLHPRLSRHYTMEVAAIEEQLPRDTKNTKVGNTNLCKLNIVTISSISLTVHKHTAFSENQFWFKHVARSQAAELDACTVIHHNHILPKQCRLCIYIK